MDFGLWQQVLPGAADSLVGCWLHQSMTGLPRFGPSNGYKVVRFADFRRSPHQIPVHKDDMTEPTQSLNINTQHNVYVVEELIQLIIESNAEIIANSHWTKDLT